MDANDPRLDPARWGTVFGVLSLDVVAPLTSSMALSLPSGPGFVEGLRRRIELYRSGFPAVDADAAPFTPAVLDWCAAEFGPEFRRHLVRWGEEVFQYSGTDSVPAFLWASIIRRGNASKGRGLAPFPERIRAVRQRLSEAKAPPAPRPRPRPSTEWDLAYYARHGYDAFFDPMDMVENTIDHVAFVRAWYAAVPTDLEEAEVAAIEHWGLEEARALGMPLDRLGRPGDWPRLPADWKAGAGGR